jgi:hypothetical protein
VHLPVVLDERVDAAGGDGERAAGEVARDAVVANAPFEGRHVELVDEM